MPSCTVTGCGASFETHGELRKHHRLMHEAYANPFACKNCPQRFAKWAFLVRHLNQRHPFSLLDLPVPCDYCSRRFASAKGKNQHVRSLHVQQVKQQEEEAWCATVI